MATFKKTVRPAKAGGDKLGRWVLWLMAVLVIGYGVWFLNTHSLQTIKNRYKPLPEVDDNPYFAASLLLKSQGKQGIYVERHEADATLKQLWQDTDNASQKTAILHHIGDAQKNDLDKMVDWMQAGGHLVVFSQDNFEVGNEAAFEDYQDYENPLLIKLGIYNQYINDEFQTETNPTHSWSINPYQIPLKIGDAIVILNDEQKSVFNTDTFVKNYAAEVYDYQAVSHTMSKSEFDGRFAPLNDDEKGVFYQAIKANPNYFLPYGVMVDAKLGKGRLTVLDIDKPFNNPYGGGFDPTNNDDESSKAPQSRLSKLLLGDYGYGDLYYGGVASNDNGFLLNYLTIGRQEVLFVPAFERTPLSALIKKNLPFMLFAVVAMMALALLALPRQFGRHERILDDSDKNVLSYYTAIGQYLWASDLCEAQVAINRERLIEKIRAVLPSIHKVGDEDQLSHLIAKDCNLPPEVVFLALYGDWDNEREFVAMTRAFARVAKFYL